WRRRALGAVREGRRRHRRPRQQAAGRRRHVIRLGMEGPDVTGRVPEEGSVMTMTPLRQRTAWKELENHHADIAPRHLRELFAEDSGRGERLTVEAVGIYLDYSKNRITDETMRLLLQLAQESDLEAHRDAMFRGDHINVSENRAVLHVALR